MKAARKSSIEEELKHAVSYLKDFKKKKKKLRDHHLNIRYCDKMIPFLKGRISGLEFTFTAPDLEKKYK
jgi:hypothetical protein